VVAAGLAQIGEFSFIIAQQGLDLGLVAPETYNVILAASVITIAANPLAFRAIPLVEAALQRSGLWHWLDRQGQLPVSLESPRGGHVVIAGYGRVGELAGHALHELSMPFAVIEARLDLARSLNAGGIPAVWGDAASGEVLSEAGVEHARLLVLCVPDQSTALLAIANARRLNPEIPIVTRAQDGTSLAIQRSLGASEVVVPEYEGAVEIVRQVLLLTGFPETEAMERALAARELHYRDLERIEGVLHHTI
jgi:CPA2 family monovalent cation:H+ antiporter-2